MESLDHKLISINEPGLIDVAKCSCGWESSPYYDGEVWAFQDWEQHVKKALIDDGVLPSGSGLSGDNGVSKSDD